MQCSGAKIGTLIIVAFCPNRPMYMVTVATSIANDRAGTDRATLFNLSINKIVGVSLYV